MPTASKDTAGWIVNYTVNGTKDGATPNIIFATENQFVDADCAVYLTVPGASSPTLSLTDISTGLSMGNASNGVYSPVVSASGNVGISTAGWITSGNHNVTDSSFSVGTVNQSIIQNGNTTVASGSTINPSDSSQTITITEGYNAARTIIIGAADSSAAGEITSGSATIDTLSYLYNSTSGKFTISGSGDVSAPTVNNAGYISATKGTKNANSGGATVAATVDKVEISSSLSGATTSRKPTLAKQTISTTGVTDAASGSATTSAPSSGVYVAVRSNANTETITATPSVTGAGYGDTTNYAVGTAATATVGAAQSDIHYIPITTTTATVDGRTVSYGSGWITAGSSSVATGSVTSGAGTATISTPTWDSTNSKFTQTASGNIAAPTVNTAGYISATEGTRTGNTLSGSKDLSTVTVGVTVSGTAKVTPVIKRTAKAGADTWVDAASGAVTTTKPTSGAYVQVDADAASNNLTITGKVTGEGYGTTAHYNADTATTTAVGSNAATTAYVPIKAGTITSGSASITSTSIAYNSTSGKFDITGSANVSAPTIGTEGYVSSSVGTKNANNGGATLSSTMDKIGIQANLSGTGTKKPSIAKDAATNIDAAGSATTSQPASGYYIAVSSAANTGTVQATASVTSAGYGTTTSGQYTTTPSSSLTVGASASDVTYIPLTGATFANSGTSGTTYTDISSSAPVLVSGDYLYINEGYTPDVKISLAKLVPDATGANASASYILSGYTAFDNDGALIVGSMQTYDGTYTIS